MKIETLEKIRVPAGVRLLLTAEQLDARRHNVALDDDGVALITTPMEFKAGETLGVVGELPIVIHPSCYLVLDDVKDGKKKAKDNKAKDNKAVSDDA